MIIKMILVFLSIDGELGENQILGRSGNLPTEPDEQPPQPIIRFHFPPKCTLTSNKYEVTLSIPFHYLLVTLSYPLFRVYKYGADGSQFQ